MRYVLGLAEERLGAMDAVIRVRHGMPLLYRPEITDIGALAETGTQRVHNLRPGEAFHGVDRKPGLHWPEERTPELAVREDRLYFRNSSAPRTAVVPIHGMILKGAPAWLRSFAVDPLLIAQGVEEAVADDDIDDVLLMVDSPGGVVDGLTEAGERIFRQRNQKPIMAQVDGMAASAAYYLASQADRIYLPTMDRVGSIGVRAFFFDTSKLAEDIGLKPILVDTGEYKSIGAPGVPVTDAQIAQIRQEVDTYFEDFLGAVARGRAMPMERVREVADGRMFFGRDAVALGLADKIQTAREGLEMAGRAARRPSTRSRLQLAQAKARNKVN